MCVDESDVLALIRERESGILQSSLWKVLNIDSRKCSRIVARLLEKGLITREPITANGTRTFLIRPVCVERPRRRVELRKDIDYSLLLSGGCIAPCAGCTEECYPEYCGALGEWTHCLNDSFRG